MKQQHRPYTIRTNLSALEISHVVWALQNKIDKYELEILPELQEKDDHLELYSCRGYLNEMKDLKRKMLVLGDKLREKVNAFEG